MRLILGSAESVHPYHLQWVDETWTKVDKFVKGEGIVNMDATALEYPDGTIEAIYASHLLEHFSYHDIPTILSHWSDKLESGGWLHINVPDMEWVAKVILGQPTESPAFPTIQSVVYAVVYGSQSHEGEYHKSGFTKSMLESLLREAGFSEITITQEREAHEMDCLVVDAYKP